MPHTGRAGTRPRGARGRSKASSASDTIESVLSGIRISMASDADVRRYSTYVSSGMRELLERCEIAEDGTGSDAYTKALVEDYICFVVCPENDIGGSVADYCSEHALSAIRGHRIRLREEGRAAIAEALERGIGESALHPEKELAILRETRVIR